MVREEYRYVCPLCGSVPKEGDLNVGYAWVELSCWCCKTFFRHPKERFKVRVAEKTGEVI